MTDWEKIKTEYLSGNTSYRKLSAKHGVPLSRIKNRGKKEDWPWLRENVRHDSLPLLHDSLCEKNSRSAQKIIDVADRILDKINESLDALPTIDGNTLKHFTAALKELRDIKGVKSEADIREQEIRMENLRVTSAKSGDTTSIEVVFNAGDDAWNE